MKEYIYKFYLPEEGEGPEDATEFTSIWTPEGGVHHILEDAAMEYYGEHGGAKEAWPIVFMLLDGGGNRLAKAKMHCDFEPEFNAELLTSE